VGLSNLRALLPEPKRSAPARPGSESSCCDLQLFQQVLGEARATVESWGGQLVFVYLPGWERFGVRRVERWSAPVRAREQVLSLMRGMGVPVIDVTAAFRTHADPTSFFYFRGSHYNVGGARLAAETVLQGLGADRP
jgi:hypothetical protein